MSTKNLSLDLFTDKYQPHRIEEIIQSLWVQHNVYQVSDKEDKSFYACSMLPYPSGKLHMGHVRNYTLNDVMARFLRSNGYHVLMPMGWDAFGMPAENAAISANEKLSESEEPITPHAWTYQNIAEMKNQLQPLGLSFDWSREIATCDPSYYRWNQWFFLKMLEKGIAYKKTQVVNWDPIDQTVLANEQVIDGRGWRSGAMVEKKEVPGYYLAITKYAKELLDPVSDPTHPDYLSGWPHQVRAMQENWIGESSGLRFAFTHNIVNEKNEVIDGGRLYVFTTRADTIMGVSFVAVAPEHPIAMMAAQSNPAVSTFIAECRKGGTTEAELATKEKLGVFTGLTVKHPLSGQDIPVWVGNYVLMSYGDGAVMGVPAHDERDFAFAIKYGLPIQQVIQSKSHTNTFNPTIWQDWYAEVDDIYCVNSDFIDNLSHIDAINAVSKSLIEKGLGERKVTYRLRDWGISRQRYWGTPIPIIQCPHCGDVPVPYDQLPVVLPTELIPDGSGNPLKHCDEFVNTTCPKCGSAAKRETDTMDTFVDSSWYFMRYCCPDSSSMVDERVAHWMPMNQYIGGIEHAVLHLLYARFWTKVMRDLGLIDFSEPFSNLFTQGMLLNDSFYREDLQGKKIWFYPSEVNIEFDDKGRPTGATLLSDGLPVKMGGLEKMSKSKNNVVEPKQLIEQYGADTVRLFTMFVGPPEQSAAWSNAGVEGAHRFIKRLWTFCYRHQSAIVAGHKIAKAHKKNWTKDEKQLRFEMYRHLQQATFDYERMQYNTVVSTGMKMLNALESTSVQTPGLLTEMVQILLQTLYPVTPHITSALWCFLGYDSKFGDLITAQWPIVDQDALIQDEIELMLQINGKLRGSLVVSSTADQQTIQQLVVEHPKVAELCADRSPKKIIVVKGKLVNVVI